MNRIAVYAWIGALAIVLAAIDFALGDECTVVEAECPVKYCREVEPGLWLRTVSAVSGLTVSLENDRIPMMTYCAEVFGGPEESDCYEILVGTAGTNRVSSNCTPN